MVNLNICSTRKTIVLTGLTMMTAMLIDMARLGGTQCYVIVSTQHMFTYPVHCSLYITVSRAKVDDSFYCMRVRIFLSSYLRVVQCVQHMAVQVSTVICFFNFFTKRRISHELVQYQRCNATYVFESFLLYITLAVVYINFSSAYLQLYKQ